MLALLLALICKQGIGLVFDSKDFWYNNLMLDQIILGIIQGIFEWIPVSSQGILALVSQYLIDSINPIDVALFLHLGTLLAIVVYFVKDWRDLILLQNPKLLRFLVITTIVSLVIGFPIYQLVRSAAIGSILLLITGFGLLLTAYFHRKKTRFKLGLDKLALLTGALQGLAVIPGLSRSGSTVFGLSLGELSPSRILKLSYMMSAPVVLISSVFFFLETPSLAWNLWPSLIISFVVGLISLRFLMKAISRINFFKFALVFALLCFLGAIIGFIV